MQADSVMDEILKHIDNDNVAEAFSRLVNYAYKNNADDKTMDEVLSLVAETDLKTVNKVDVKTRINALLNNIGVEMNEPATKANDELSKLSRDNFFHQTKPSLFMCKGVGKRLGAFSLENISLDLHVGEITAVVGENGNGKTTLCRIVAGLLMKEEGQMSYPYLEQDHPERLNWKKIKSKIAYLPQEVQTLAGTIKNTLELECSIRGILGQDNIQRVNVIIRRLGLTEYENARWDELSGGYKLRFALARVLLWRPSLIILDEPLANLDLKAQVTVLSDLRDFANSFAYPLGILVTSQHIHEVEYIADKIIFLKNGKTLYYDDVNSIGLNRSRNNFEIGCRYLPEDMEKALSNCEVSKIKFNGLYFELETSNKTNAFDVLQALNTSGIEIKYFRDVSNSTKKYFLTND